MKRPRGPCGLPQEREQSLVPEPSLMATALQRQLPCRATVRWAEDSVLGLRSLWSLTLAVVPKTSVLFLKTSIFLPKQPE